MKKSVLITVFMVICLPLNALSKEENKVLQFHSGGVPEAPASSADGETGLAKALKNVKLSNYQSKTFGEAVSSYRYFTKKEWKETHSSNGKIYVDFTGWLKKSVFGANSVAMRGVGIKFLVKPDGNFAVVMVSKVEIITDGSIQVTPQPDISALLNKLYSNIEIKL